jgi:hypothetical protein
MSCLLEMRDSDVHYERLYTANGIHVLQTTLQGGLVPSQMQPGGDLRSSFRLGRPLHHLL